MNNKLKFLFINIGVIIVWLGINISIKYIRVGEVDVFDYEFLLTNFIPMIVSISICSLFLFLRYKLQKRK